MKAEIIAAGSEMLTPFRQDTNSLFLTAQLNRLGIRVMRKVIVGDDREELRDAFRESLGRADVVISIGGLGPTEDDLTREVAAELLGRKLKRSDAILHGIEERFRRFGRTMPEINARQAMVPDGAEPLQNPRGTAPGLWLESEGRIVILLPGPPQELEPMFQNEVFRRLEKHAPKLRLHTRDLRIAGMPESEVDHRVAPIYKQYPQAETTILAAAGEIQLHPRIWSEDHEAAERLLNEMVERIHLALGDAVFSTHGESLEDVVGKILIENRATLAVAESCTGGMVSMRLTNIPGSSSYFCGGAVVYSNELKSLWADVPPEVIEKHGAVSAEAALALADGVRRRTGATLGLGITGVAGPGGGSAEKPVGLVHSAIADESGGKQKAFRFPGDRDHIRVQASQAALDMVRRYYVYAARGVA
ncbi:MAG: competence/damage-inducible protein A [Candidatus Acidiferrales bacterium]